jgi:dipeptidyl aminopeptidase/acylaminoacyl peptidase
MIPRTAPRSLRALFCAALLAALAAPAVRAQAAPARAWDVDSVIRAERFVSPPDAVASAVLAPRHRNVTLSDPSPDRTRFLNEVGDGPVTMDVFSRPFHELGGLFVDFRANRNRTLTIRSSVGLEIIAAADGRRTAVELPAGLRISAATWSPDGRSVAFWGHTPDATHLWVADAATGRARQVTRTPVLATLLTSFAWTADSRRIATVLVPEGRAAMPLPPAVPQGPQVKLAENRDRNRLRTYASLLATPHDQALLEWHATGQAALVDVQTRAVTAVGRPAMIRGLDPSPDGRFVRVTRMVKPFSYVVPVGNFGTVEEVWDLSGRVLAELLAEPLNLGIDTARTPTAPGVGGADDRPAGRREIAWREDGRGLTFLDPAPAPPGADTAAADGQQRPRRRDRVMQWVAPFDSAGLRVLYQHDGRLTNHRFSPDHTVLVATERTGQSVHEFAVLLGDSARRVTLARFRADDVYANPGSLVMARGGMPAATGGFGGFGGFGEPRTAGRAVQVSPDGAAAYYYGTAYDRDPLANGPRTFIDRVDLRTGRKTRVYESSNEGVYERVLAWQDLEARRLVVQRESPTEVPQSFLRDGDRLVRLTDNRDYTPDLTRAPRERFIVERPDGFRFRVEVTLPPDHRPGTRLPAMFWFYPREYAGQEEYDRGARTWNRNAFPQYGPRSIAFLARMGYAVVEPDSPIIGANGLYNNNYENDLRNNLAAVIDELDRRGLVDRTRLGIGGHSYGAFSTVNAMAHTPFFRAGIAGDGNYNRTLTPLSFQTERRDLWEARETYLNMSPILHANNLTGALLMYHGLHDQNVGTDPINSPRLFHALNGLGKITSMYLYPFEDHGPATRETLLDLWGRWSAWLEKYVKAPARPGQTGPKPVSE